MKYSTVWTSKKISDFVTKYAVNDGGKVIKDFTRQCDAINYATSLNRSGSGYYCVMITI